MSGLIGIVVVAHAHISTALVEAARTIIPDAHSVTAVPIESNAPVDTNRALIAAAIARVDQGRGVLLLTDMFGGTPSNLCLAFLKLDAVEVVSGVNLPMLIKLLGGVQEQPFIEVVPFIQRYGQKNILIASAVLQGKIEAAL